MYYKCTLLKDLPEYAAGTVFYAEDKFNEKNEKTGYYVDWERTPRTDDFLTRISLLFDNEKWIKKEIDFSKLTELSCPACGGTKIYPLVERSSGRPGDRRLYYITVTAHCPCGNEYPLIEKTLANEW